ncbi:hypothetical protein AUC60_18825 [Pseudomonas caspiana]|uniref:Uncharacterized protein n=1 Tax=Pseudomonas caspiana TaxID=1451454 RepID=A0A1Y3NXU2_9PSED|nr:hypothetical protein AUC60_18825 [Pseudomonas caspiana]
MLYVVIQRWGDYFPAGSGLSIGLCGFMGRMEVSGERGGSFYREDVSKVVILRAKRRRIGFERKCPAPTGITDDVGLRVNMESHAEMTDDVGPALAGKRPGQSLKMCSQRYRFPG